MKNYSDFDDAEFSTFVEKHMPNTSRSDPENCIVLDSGLSENEINAAYEKIKKHIYSQDRILEAKKSTQPNYKTFNEVGFNHSLKLNSKGICFQINSYVPENLKEIIDDNIKYKNVPVYIGIHGAGSSSFTFSTLCSHLKSINPDIVFISYDLRGHGLTTVTSEETITYNLSDFVDDTIDVVTFALKEIFKDVPRKASIVFLGHSLGGSICSHLISTKDTNSDIGLQLWRKNVLGIAVLDIVEQVAIESLGRMDVVIKKTPMTFPNVKQCINWHIGSNTLQNYDSAKFSIPYLFKLCRLKDDKYFLSRITNFNDFKPYWNTWFVGLSDTFVNSRGVSKLLILSGADQRNQDLDKELIIGQMQGKYQLNIFNNGGHFIHEDCDFNVALTLDEFVKRNDNKLVVIKTNWKSLQ